MFLSLTRHFSGGFDVPVLCTDCMENGNSYSRPPDYFCQGIVPPPGMEYQQIPPTSTFASHKPPEGQCNGTPNGVRKEATPTSHKKHGDTKGEDGEREGGKNRPAEPRCPMSVCHTLTGIDLLCSAHKRNSRRPSSPNKGTLCSNIRLI